MTQVERIEEYMRRHGSITTLEAMRDLGVLRLSARIYDLRAKGLEIDSDFVKAMNRYGENVHFNRYYFKEEVQV